jgi:tetratricopeptide (TPR) repeat protein
MEQVRAKVMESALRFTETLASENAHDSSLQWERANALLRAGNTRVGLGDYAAGEEAFRKAISVLDQLLDQFPDNSNYLIGVASAWNSLALLHKTKGEMAQAASDFQRLDQLLREFPVELRSHVDYRRFDAILKANRALLLLGNRNFSEAEPLCREVISLKESLVRDYPDSVEFADSLAASYGALGSLFRQTNRISDAIVLQRKSVDVFENLAKRQPARRDSRLALA